MIAGLTHAEIAKGCIAAYDDFEALIAGLDDAGWRTPTRLT